MPLFVTTSKTFAAIKGLTSPNRVLDKGYPMVFQSFGSLQTSESDNDYSQHIIIQDPSNSNWHRFHGEELTLSRAHVTDANQTDTTGKNGTRITTGKSINTDIQDSFDYVAGLSVSDHNIEVKTRTVTFRQSNSYYRFIYHPSNGVLVKTSILGSSNTMLVVHIIGNSYSSTLGVPFNTTIQLYNYNDGNSIINYKCIHHGYDFGSIIAFVKDSYVCLWFTQPTNYCSFGVFVHASNGAEFNTNSILSLTNTAWTDTGVTRKVTITSASNWQDGLLHIKGAQGSYTEGIRIYPSSDNWATIVLGGADLTAKTGTSTNSWTIHNNNGNFYINRNGSSTQQASRLWGHGSGFTFGNTTLNSYAINTASFISADWVRTKGSTGWYSQDYGGGWFMQDATWIRNYNNKNLYLNTAIGRTDGSWQVGDGGARFIAKNSTTNILGVNTSTPAYHADINGDLIVTNWIRTRGNHGWYSETHHGGIWQDEATWLKNYNNCIPHWNITNANTYGIGGHRLAEVLRGDAHVSTLWHVNGANVAWGLCANSNGNFYLGKRTNGSLTSTTDDFYLLHFTTDCINMSDGKYITSPRYISRVATGTQPYACSSTTVNANLNADLLDGYHASGFVKQKDCQWNASETVDAWAKRIIGGEVPTIYNESGWGWASSKNLNLSGTNIDSQRYSAIDFRRGNLNSTWQQKAIMFLPTYTDQSMIYIAQMTTSGTAGSVSTSVKQYADYTTTQNWANGRFSLLGHTHNYANASHSHDNIISSGNVTCITGATVPADGLRLLQAYNNGYPATYGNIIQVKGSGSGQLMLEWKGDTNCGNVYYRSKRDVAATNWSGWQRLAFASEIPTIPTQITPTNHTHSLSLTSGVLKVTTSGGTTGQNVVSWVTGSSNSVGPAYDIQVVSSLPSDASSHPNRIYLVV